MSAEVIPFPEPDAVLMLEAVAALAPRMAVVVWRDSETNDITIATSSRDDGQTLLLLEKAVCRVMEEAD